MIPIIPSTSLFELMKRIGAKEDMIEVAFSENYIVFKSKSMLFHSRLIEGRYPNITSLKPKETKAAVTLNRKQFLQGVGRACLFKDEWKDNNIFINVVDATKIRISSGGSEIVKIEESQKIIGITGDMEVGVSLNGKYLIDALKAMKTKELNLTLGGSMQPIYLEPLGDTSYLQLISQVRSR